MRTRAPRSIGISLVAAAMVLGMPASAYALYGPIGFVLSAIGVLALLGLAAFVIFRWGDPEFRHRVGAVSFVVVIGGTLVALVSTPLVVSRDRLTSEAEVQRHCPGAAGEPLEWRDFESRDLPVTVSEARGAGLPAPRYPDLGLLFEPVATSPEEHFDVITRSLGTRWVGWYEAAPDPAQPGRRFALLTLRREPQLRTELVGLVERHETVQARAVRVIGDRIAVHRDDAESTLELRDATLAIRTRATLRAEGTRLFTDGVGGACALRVAEKETLFWHLDGDGRTTRRQMDGGFFGYLYLGYLELHSCDADGLCFRARGGIMRMEGDPLRPVTFDLATIARENQSLLLVLLGALLFLVIGFAFLHPHLRLVLALRRTPLVGRLRTLGDRTRVLVDRRGDEHPIERIDAFVGFDPATDSDDEPCTALGVTSLGTDGGPFRGAPARLVLRVVIAGTLDEARAIARRRLLDRVSHVGLALLVTGAPCVLAALILLFAA